MIKINEIYSDLINKFPAEIDPNKIFKDVTIETKPLVDKYYRLYNTNDFDGAAKLIEDNPILQDMIVNSYIIQYLYDMNISTQRFYMNDIQQYLVNLVKFKKEYNQSEKYTKYDVVLYVRQGLTESFMAIKADIPIGTKPTNTEYWVPITLRGEKGVSGTGLAWRGNWNKTIQYSKDDCVCNNNVLWGAKQDNIGRLPQEISDYWERVMELKQQITVDVSPPSIPNYNDILFLDKGDDIDFESLGGQTFGNASLYPETDVWFDELPSNAEVWFDGVPTENVSLNKGADVWFDEKLSK